MNPAVVRENDIIYIELYLSIIRVLAVRDTLLFVAYPFNYGIYIA